MGTKDRLRDIDRRFMEVTPKKWDNAVRRWWWALLLPPFYSGLLILGHADIGFAVFLAVGGWVPIFMAGYFYNERLRQLGREAPLAGWRKPPGA